ncbi:hypothetical protein [Erythrobacter mangrovi]|uniref:Lipoprotein n=1 Tax=Erythrobacter mangrovi TaxID=2739433 RepID=A0A7D4BXG4_9SPHN|nr:hypothetical protein [Erythrobacter mangrovi]QKG72587.1 hypothetical protein HQR01_15110 [Erythrobacter mangrovi]
MKRFVTFSLLALASPAAAEPDLRFSITEERIQNEFFRDGPISAHAVLRSGPEARVVIAFPAGNSGVGLWFREAATWQVAAPLEARQQQLQNGRLRRGVVTDITADADTLTVQRALVGSVRVLRDYGYRNPIPAEVEATPKVSGNKVIWQRTRLDGGTGYFMEVEILNGTTAWHEGAIVLTSQAGPLRLRITALTGDEPLAPLTVDEIFKRPAQSSQLQDSFAFLAYREKLLAGSWRFNTYFGRDTLMTLALMMNELKPAPIEAGLSSILERLNPVGEVAHEEGIGEFALIGKPGHDVHQPDLDYNMVDDDFMLAPVLAAYLLDTPEGRDRATDFLARRDANGVSYGEHVLRNFAYVARRARPFAAKPSFESLIPIKEGLEVGDWRDSVTGLGRDGRFSFSINAALVPAALAAANQLVESGLLEQFGAEQGELRDLDTLARVWKEEAPTLFTVSLPPEDAQARLAMYAQDLGVHAPGIDGQATVRFMALALDEKGQPLRVIHSDVGFLLFFLRPDDATIKTALNQAIMPFPLGLMSDAGLFASNPAFAGADRTEMFDKTRYHGTVVWSWQQGLFRAGVQCQLERDDLSDETRALLEAAYGKITQAIERTVPLQGAELWSWRLEDGKYVAQPYGQASDDETESNAAQLWSAIALAHQGHCGPR